MRNVVKFLLTLAIGIALIWVGFWWYAESRLQSGFTDWAEQQATQGWKISYDSIQRGNSLMDAAITIQNLSLTLPPGPSDTATAISLPAVTLRIHALNPLVFHTDLPNRIGIAIGDNLNLVCNTGSIALAENLDPDKMFKRADDPFRGGDFTATNIDILASAGSLLILHIDKIASHADFNQDASASQTALYSNTALDGLAISPILARIASIPFDGRLAHLSFSSRLSGPVPANLQTVLDQLSATPGDRAAEQKLLTPVIHQWASQGGSGNAALNVTLGPSNIATAGTVKFDANLQPNGTADLTADHLDQLAAAIVNAYPSLQDDITRAEAQSSEFLSNNDQNGQTLTLHLAYGKPGIMINGQKRADMPPLDWNAAENPLPPPTQAPGDGSGATGSGAALPNPTNQ